MAQRATARLTRDASAADIGTVSATQQLSPRGATLFGLFSIVAGLYPIAIGLGIITPPSVDLPPPDWVPAAAGLMFVFAGVAVIIDYGIAGGVGPDGDLLPGTPFWIRSLNFVLGLGIVGMMAAVFGWVAFGPGPRTFSTTIVLPFLVRHNPHAGELSGRIAFGIGAILLALMFVACGVVGAKRLARAWRGQ